MSEIILPRRVLAQPTPAIVSGGDCGACVLGGILGASVERVYQFAGESAALSYYDVLRALRKAREAGICADLDNELTPDGEVYTSQQVWGKPSWLLSTEWFEHLWRYLSKGYYAVAQVDFQRRGPLFEHDHYVLLCGARACWKAIEQSEVGGQRLVQEVLVSCSASNQTGEWNEADYFLRLRGGFNLIFAKPFDETENVMDKKFPIALNHSINLALILVSALLVVYNHYTQGTGPLTLDDFLPLAPMVAQYVNALKAHGAPSSKIVTPSQVKLILQLLKEREVTHLEVAEVTNGLEVDELTLSTASRLIDLLLEKPRKKKAWQ